jgi:hypothetical protein
MNTALPRLYSDSAPIRVTLVASKEWGLYNVYKINKKMSSQLLLPYCDFFMVGGYVKISVEQHQKSASTMLFLISFRFRGSDKKAHISASFSGLCYPIQTMELLPICRHGHGA